MMEQTPFDDNLKKRLEAHESPLPQDLFELIQAARTVQLDTPSLKDRLSDHESAVPFDMFDRIQNARDFKTEEPSLKDRLSDYESPVSSSLFEKIAFERDHRITNADLQPSLSDQLFQYESAVPTGMFERIMAEREKERPVFAWWQFEYVKRMAATVLLVLLVSGTIAYLINYPSNTEGGNSNSEKQGISTDFSTNTGISNEKPALNTETDNDKNKPEHTSKALAETAQATKKQNLNSKIQISNSKFQVSGLKSEIRNPKSEIKAASNSTIITSNLEHQNLDSRNTTLKIPQPNYNPITIAPETDESTRKFIVVSPLKRTLTEGVAVLTLPKQAIPCLGPDHGCPTFDKKAGGIQSFYIDAYVSPEYAFRSLKPQTDEYLYYRNARDTTEKARYAVSAGVRASVVFNSGLAFRAGVVYAQNNEVLRKDSAAIGDIKWTVIQRPNGVRDTVSVEIQNGVFRKTRYNNFKTWDVTLQAGYEFPLADQLLVSVNGGANINISTAIKGTYLAKDLQPSVISTTNTPYNTSVGVSLVASVAGYWTLTDRVQLFAEPHVRYYVKPISNPVYQLRQHYTNAGIMFGVRYRLTTPSMRVL